MAINSPRENENKMPAAAQRPQVALRAAAVVTTATLAFVLLLVYGDSGSLARLDARGGKTHRIGVSSAAGQGLLNKAPSQATDTGTRSKGEDFGAQGHQKAPEAVPPLRRHPLTIGRSCALQSGNVDSAFALLCDVLKPGIDERLAKFFRLGQVPLARVYVADMEEGRTGLGSACGTFVERYFVTKGMHQGAYATKFASEVLIPDTLRRSPFAVKTPEEANLLTVDVCIMGRGQQGAWLTHIRPFLEGDARLGPIWQKHPQRFFVVLSSDHGPCSNFYEKISADRGPRDWIDRSLENTTMLLNEGSLLDGCYSREKDLTMPTSAHIGLNEVVTCSMQNRVPEQRKHTIFFAGKGSSGVRVTMQRLFEHHPDFYFPHDMTHSDYMCAMSDAVFCLAPRGQAAWSPRLDEAIAAGCIPVIIADFYDPPFQDVFEYAAFSVRISESDVETLPDFLRNITLEERKYLLSNVEKVRPFFQYLDPKEKFRIDNAASLLLFQLWERKGSDV